MKNVKYPFTDSYQIDYNEITRIKANQPLSVVDKQLYTNKTKIAKYRHNIFLYSFLRVKIKEIQ